MFKQELLLLHFLIRRRYVVVENMKFTFLAIFLYLIYEIEARYHSDILCLVDEKRVAVCKEIKGSRRDTNLKSKVPSHDAYIPRKKSYLFNCTLDECSLLKLHSMTQVTSPDLLLKTCYEQFEKQKCEPIRYNYFKNIDKLLFLSNNVENKTFYLVDCLVYSDHGRICHKKDDADSHTKLVDTGTIVRPNEANILSQDEFICEQDDVGIINCDINPFVPYGETLKLKKLMNIEGDILLKSGSYVVTLKKNCIESWCGFSGTIKATRRYVSKFEPPGGKVFQCFYAKKQQVCMPVYSQGRISYDMRGFDSN